MQNSAKAKQWFLIGLAAAVAPLTACGALAESAVERATEEIIEADSGEEVDIDFDLSDDDVSFTIETEEGTVRLDGNSDGGQVSFDGEGTEDDRVITFDANDSGGVVTIDGEGDENDATLTFDGDGDSGVVTLDAAGDENDATLTLDADDDGGTIVLDKAGDENDATVTFEGDGENGQVTIDAAGDENDTTITVESDGDGVVVDVDAAGEDNDTTLGFGPGTEVPECFPNGIGLGPDFEVITSADDGSSCHVMAVSYTANAEQLYGQYAAILNSEFSDVTDWTSTNNGVIWREVDGKNSAGQKMVVSVLAHEDPDDTEVTVMLNLSS